MKKRVLSLAVAVLATALVAHGQDRPPALVIEGTGGVSRAESLPLAVVAIEARVLGPIAETRMTLTFSNPHNRPLAGDLYFPLPEGATVSGYALDIEGTMVDGVIVEKDKGRQVFEKIVRQGVDPGLVEWAKGNNFKTRVFPIPARGRRTVTVRYVTDVAESDGAPVYRLPLRFRDELESFSIRVEVVKVPAKPEVRGGRIAGFEFKPWREGFVADATGQKTALNEDLAVALPPAADADAALVERGPDGEYYFCFADKPAPPPVRREAAARKVGIFWDASGSRGTTDHARELAILKAFFQVQKDVEVSLTLFRDRAGEPRAFAVTGGDCRELIAALEAVAYDGGTQMSALSVSADASLPDFFLVFTDGLSNYGREEPANLPRPLYILSADPAANHSFLRYLAIRSGGEYLNLHRLSDADAVAAIGGRSFGFVAASVDSGSVADLTPASRQAVYGRFVPAGRLTSEKAEITLQYGMGSEVALRRRITVSRAGAVEGDLIRRFWAQSRVTELQVFPKRNEAEIVALGKRCGLVTPGTSLIVLDNPAQYIEHRIEPPKSMPKWREQYAVAVEKADRESKKMESAKIERVLAMWTNRMAWLTREFKYAKDFRYKEKGEGKGDAGGVLAAAEERPAQGRSPAPEPATPGAVPATPAVMAPPPRSPVPAAENPSRDARAEGRLHPDDTGGRPASRVAGYRGGRAAPAAHPTGTDPQGPAGWHAKPEGTVAEPAIAITPWNPDTPYLKKLKAAAPAKRFAVYMSERKAFGQSPAFFLDCGDFFLKEKDEALALQVLSNVAELELENASLIRVLAHRLGQIGEHEMGILLFEEARRLRPEEPQSHRDLALALARRAEAAPSAAGAAPLTTTTNAYARAIELLYHVAINPWDRFDEVEVIALMELNRLLPKAKAAGTKDIRVDPRLVTATDVDLRIVMTWHADMTDIDLWVTEPSGEKALYSHPKTTIGGNVSRDFTQGYGPEEYILRKAMTGTYKVEANYYGSSAAQLIGAVTLQVDVFTNYGRGNERRNSITLRLKDKQETVKVGDVEF